MCVVHNVTGGGAVRVTTSAQRETALLTVENTGDMVSPELVETLTEPFQRGTQRVRGDHGGVGLGLAIVKSIVRAHAGILTLTPRAAGGLCVRVVLLGDALGVESR